MEIRKSMTQASQLAAEHALLARSEWRGFRPAVFPYTARPCPPSTAFSPTVISHDSSLLSPLSAYSSATAPLSLPPIFPKQTLCCHFDAPASLRVPGAMTSDRSPRLSLPMRGGRLGDRHAGGFVRSASPPVRAAPCSNASTALHQPSWRTTRRRETSGEFT